MATNHSYEPGCYLDSHRGHYIQRDMLRFAEGEGYPVDKRMDDVLSQYDKYYWEEDYPIEELHDGVQSAEDWLNEHRCPEGLCWGWNEGDFGLYPIEDEE